MNPSPKLKSIISLSIILAIAILFAYYISQHISDFKTLFSVGISNIWLVILLAILTIITLVSFFLTGTLSNELMKRSPPTNNNTTK